MILLLGQPSLRSRVFTHLRLGFYEQRRCQGGEGEMVFAGQKLCSNTHKWYLRVKDTGVAKNLLNKHLFKKDKGLPVWLTT